MSTEKLGYRHEVMQFDNGNALGCSYRWPGGQYCAIHTDRGILACGLYDCEIATKFGMVVAIARGTPEHPLCQPEDLLQAKIAAVSAAASNLGICIGMSGSDALHRLLA